jgi:hypothetical protein
MVAQLTFENHHSGPKVVLKLSSTYFSFAVVKSCNYPLEILLAILIEIMDYVVLQKWWFMYVMHRPATMIRDPQKFFLAASCVKVCCLPSAIRPVPSTRYSHLSPYDTRDVKRMKKTLQRHM